MYAKILKVNSIDMISDEDYNRAISKLKLLKGRELQYAKEHIKGFYEFVPAENVELEELDSISYSYELKNKKVYQLASVKKNSQYKISIKIKSLQSELEASDYKVIKCMEYQLANVEAPYDIVLLNNERQQKRNEISKLKTLISENYGNN